MVSCTLLNNGGQIWTRCFTLPLVIFMYMAWGKEVHRNEVMECDQRFNSDLNKTGTFSSLNYPSSYPSNTICTYTFTGRGKERVQIIFTDFDLFHPKHVEDSEKRCSDLDSVQVYIYSGGEKAKIDDYCGNTIPKQIMSNKNNMSIVFKGLKSGNVRGFQAIYNFVTNFGITTGVQINGEVCGFVYNSSVSSLGYIMSPNHPGLYPRDTECHYFFYGSPKQKVELQFAYFDVEGVTPCDAKTESDYVEFSNFQAVDRKLPRFCNPREPGKVDSDGVFFRVTFKSNSIFDGTGFKAQYQFITTEANNEPGGKENSKRMTEEKTKHRMMSESYWTQLTFYSSKTSDSSSIKSN